MASNHMFENLYLKYNSFHRINGDKKLAHKTTGLLYKTTRFLIKHIIFH